MSGRTIADAHLIWIAKHPEFIPPTWSPTTVKIGNYILPEITYYELMEEVYKFSSRDDKMLAFDARANFEKDIKYFVSLNEITKNIVTGYVTSNKKFFITIGFNHQTWSVSQCISVIQNVLDNKIILSGKAVFELYRTNGEHPHCHFLVELSESIPRSKLAEKIFAVKGIKKVVLKKTFIDIKESQPYHEKYINGDKIEEKMKLCNLDFLFREKNNIPHFFCK